MSFWIAKNPTLLSFHNLPAFPSFLLSACIFIDVLNGPALKKARFFSCNFNIHNDSAVSIPGSHLVGTGSTPRQVAYFVHRWLDHQRALLPGQMSRDRCSSAQIKQRGWSTWGVGELDFIPTATTRTFPLSKSNAVSTFVLSWDNLTNFYLWYVILVSVIFVRYFMK